jgi:transcription-repair coupling factor (superfamily II helicase)
LGGLGYQYSNIVVQPGQFSRRGGILDIWSPAEEMPVRVEFFGDEIDTLKHFDPSTQRTVNTLEKTFIFPASEALPMAAEKKGLLTEGLSEFEIPQLYDFPSSLMDYLPNQTLILLDGEDLLRQQSTISKKKPWHAFRAWSSRRFCLRIFPYRISLV